MDLSAYSSQAIAESHLRIQPFIHRTPVLTSTAINQEAGCSLFFKCENFQKVGAFKMRGASNAIAQLNEEEKAKGVVTHSSGNHAQAVARSANILGITAHIVMPSNAPSVKIAAVKGYGGIVHLCEPTLKAREENSQRIIDELGCTFIHPYNNKNIILGQATAAKELLEEEADLEIIIAPIGGGGLLSGSTLSAKHFGKDCIVYGSEPEGADDAYRSFKSGSLMRQTNPNTLADGLLTSLGEHNFEIIKSYVEDILLVSDDETINAMQLIWERMKIIIEPSCAVPLAAVLRNKPLFEGKKVGVILSGGNLDLGEFFQGLKSIRNK